MHVNASNVDEFIAKMQKQYADTSPLSTETPSLPKQRNNSIAHKMGKMKASIRSGGAKSQQKTTPMISGPSDLRKTDGASICDPSGESARPTPATTAQEPSVEQKKPPFPERPGKPTSTQRPNPPQRPPSSAPTPSTNQSNKPPQPPRTEITIEKPMPPKRLTNNIGSDENNDQIKPPVLPSRQTGKPAPPALPKPFKGNLETDNLGTEKHEEQDDTSLYAEVKKIPSTEEQQSSNFNKTRKLPPLPTRIKVPETSDENETQRIPPVRTSSSILDEITDQSIDDTTITNKPLVSPNKPAPTPAGHVPPPLPPRTDRAVGPPPLPPR